MSDETSESKPVTPAPGLGENMALPSLGRGRTKKRGGDGAAGDDAFLAGAQQLGRKAAGQGRAIALAVVVAVTVVVAVVVWAARSEQSSATATRLLAKAASYEARAAVGDAELLADKNRGVPTAPIVPDEAARTEAVQKLLGELTEAAGDRGAGLDGRLIAAAGLLRSGDAAAAEASYREFLEKAPAGHPLRWAAREGLGFAREAQGDLAGALEEFKGLAGERGVFYRDMGLWHQGRILERMERPSEALELYRQYIAEYPISETSLAQSEVRRRLEDLDPTALSTKTDDAVATPGAAEAAP